jgi:hypothetical protein
MYKRILTFLKKVILLLLSLVLLLSAVACNQDTDTDDGKETYKEGLCGPDDIPKDVKMSYYGENLAELKKVYYDEYKKKCDFKCLVPNIENADNVTDLEIINDYLEISVRPIWNNPFPVKKHCLYIEYAFKIADENGENRYYIPTCDYKINYFDGNNVDISDLDVEIDNNASVFYIKYDGYILIECYNRCYSVKDDVIIENEASVALDRLIDITLENIEYWG